MALRVKMNVLATILFIGCLAFPCVVQSTPDTTLKTFGCDGATFKKNDPFKSSLAFVLADLTTVTPNTKGFDRYTRSPDHSNVIFGHAACHTNLAPAICTICLLQAAHIIQGCGATNGQTVLGDCKIEYGSQKI